MSDTRERLRWRAEEAERAARLARDAGDYAHEEYYCLLAHDFREAAK